MNFIDKLEKKVGKHVVNNLMIYLIIFFVAGYFMNLYNPYFYDTYLALDIGKVFGGEVWRLVTFLCYPPSNSIFLLLISIFIYYSLGKTLERIWGTFKFNLYIFAGILGVILASVIIYLIWGVSYHLTADQIYLSMLLAMAATFPDATFLFFFIIPIKAKYLGILYGVILVYDVVKFIIIGAYANAIEIVLSLINFIIYFILIKKKPSKTRQKAKIHKITPEYSADNQKKIARHRCCICGITDIDSPDMEFRYCSMCNGAMEYCSAHIHNHIHKE